MKLRVTLAILLFSLQARTQVNIDLDVPVIVTFGSTLSGVSNGAFTGSGFISFPGSGRLDSDGWAISGFSDGDLGYGGTVLSGDLARGTTTMLNPTTDVGATIGGIYSYTGSPFSISNPAMLIQPTDADCTPGGITLKVKNNHPTETIYLLDVDYDLWVRNNTSTSSKIAFSWSEDNVTYSSVSSLDYTSATTSSATGITNTGVHTYTIVGCDVTPGEFIYLRWTVSDVSGSGERDEFYIDDITVTASNLLPITLATFTAEVVNAVVEMQWATATEENSDHFIVERKTGTDTIFSEIGIVPAAGTTVSETFYSFTDDAPDGGTNYYRLKLVDADGKLAFSKIVSVKLSADADETILLAPNPAENMLMLTADNNSIQQIKIFNTAGKEVTDQLGMTQSDAGLYFDLQKIPAAMYLIQVITADGIITKQFVKTAGQ